MLKKMHELLRTQLRKTNMRCIVLCCIKSPPPQKLSLVYLSCCHLTCQLKQIQGFYRMGMSVYPALCCNYVTFLCLWSDIT